MTVTVAVVDDDVSILDALEMLLGAEGWTVKAYATGEAFLADFQRYDPPDCLILDPHLPGINGAAVAQAVIDAGVSTPIITLTARPNSPITRQIMHSGAYKLLTKPIAADTLIGHINASVKRVGYH